MVDPLRHIAGVQHIPTSRFVCVDGGLGANASLHERNALRLGLEHASEGVALTFTSYDNNLPFAGLMLGQAAINAVFHIILRADVTPEIRAINGNVRGQLRGCVLLSFKRFAQLVRKDKGRLVADF